MSSQFNYVTSLLGVSRLITSGLELTRSKTLKASLTSLTSLTLLIALVTSNNALAKRATHPPSDKATSHISLNNERCGRDSYEPNDRRYKARNISNELNTMREVSANLCTHDRDWYTVWLNHGELVELYVTASLETPPSLKVFAPRRRKPSGITRLMSPSQRRVKVYAKKAGRYRILVSGGREAQTRYRLSLKRPTRYGL